VLVLILSLVLFDDYDLTSAEYLISESELGMLLSLLIFFTTFEVFRERFTLNKKRYLTKTNFEMLAEEQKEELPMSSTLPKVELN
jgi:hypothetical protein